MQDYLSHVMRSGAFNSVKRYDNAEQPAMLNKLNIELMRNVVDLAEEKRLFTMLLGYYLRRELLDEEMKLLYQIAYSISSRR
jgi:hypothetical protein